MRWWQRRPDLFVALLALFALLGLVIRLSGEH